MRPGVSAWLQLLLDAPPESQTDDLPFLPMLAGYRAPYVESGRPFVSLADTLKAERAAMEREKKPQPAPEDDERPIGECEVCSQPYRMNTGWQRCCGQSCAATLRNQGIRERKAAQLAAGEALNAALATVEEK